MPHCHVRSMRVRTGHSRPANLQGGPAFMKLHQGFKSKQRKEQMQRAYLTSGTRSCIRRETTTCRVTQNLVSGWGQLLRPVSAVQFHHAKELGKWDQRKKKDRLLHQKTIFIWTKRYLLDVLRASEAQFWETQKLPFTCLISLFDIPIISSITMILSKGKVRISSWIRLYTSHVGVPCTDLSHILFSTYVWLLLVHAANDICACIVRTARNIWRLWSIGRKGRSGYRNAFSSDSNALSKTLLQMREKKLEALTFVHLHVPLRIYNTCEWVTER